MEMSVVMSMTLAMVVAAVVVVVVVIVIVAVVEVGAAAARVVQKVEGRMGVVFGMTTGINGAPPKQCQTVRNREE